jgi:hypothetical protein
MSYFPQEWHLAGYVSANKYAGIVECSYIFQFSHSINYKWKFLDCAAVAFSERYVLISQRT